MKFLPLLDRCAALPILFESWHLLKSVCQHRAEIGARRILESNRDCLQPPQNFHRNQNQETD